ncbi:MAG: hypothetical protein ACFFD4_33685 [Candidatus Odinarchaeota archaeon]
MVESTGELFPVSIGLSKFGPREAFITQDDDNRRIWIWKGRIAPVRLKFASATAAQQLRLDLGFVYRIDSIEQGDEPDIFIELFGEKKSLQPDLSRIEREKIETAPIQAFSIDVKRGLLDSLVDERLEHYRTNGVPAQVAERVLERFSEGIPLSPKDSSRIKLDTFLISLESAEFAFQEIIGATTSAGNRRGYAFVLGAYGSGKSQLKNRIIDHLAGTTTIVVRTDLGLPFNAFNKAMIESTMQFFSQNTMITRVEVDQLVERLLNDEHLSQKEITQYMMELIKTCNRLGVFYSFLLDEVDKIKDADDFRPWVDFLTTLHDNFTGGYSITFFTTTRDIDRLWRKDTRLERFEKWLSDPYELESSYGNKILVGAANIIALSILSTGSHLQDIAVRLVENHFEKNKRKYQSSSIRRINVLSWNLVDSLIKMENSNLWQKVKEIQGIPVLKQLSEHNLKVLLKDMEIPFTHVDEVWLAQFQTQHMNIGDLRTDIILSLNKKYEDQKMLMSTIPVRVSYNPDEEEINKLVEASRSQRIIFLVMGDQKESFDLAFNLLENEVQSYQVFLEEIDELEFLPVLALPTGSSPGEKKLFRVLKNWFSLTSSLRAKIMAWLVELAEQKRQEFLNAEIEELRALISGLKGKPGQVAINKALDELSLSTKDKKATTAGKAATGKRIVKEEALMIVISAFEMVKLRKNKVKAINSLSVDLEKQMERVHGSQIGFNAAKENIQEIINQLIEQGFLNVQNKYYSKTDKWNKSRIVEAIL